MNTREFCDQLIDYLAKAAVQAAGVVSVPKPVWDGLEEWAEMTHKLYDRELWPLWSEVVASAFNQLPLPGTRISGDGDPKKRIEIHTVDRAIHRELITASDLLAILRLNDLVSIIFDDGLDLPETQYNLPRLYLMSRPHFRAGRNVLETCQWLTIYR
jgi:hypothetical protein